MTEIDQMDHEFGRVLLTQKLEHLNEWEVKHEHLLFHHASSHYSLSSLATLIFIFKWFLYCSMAQKTSHPHFQ